MSQSVDVSAGHLIAKQIESEGIQRVYLVPGESYLDLIDGLTETDVQTVVCRQEGGAGYMALSEGRMTGLPGIAMVTRGPGAANAQVAMHTAAQDGTPMILFVGLIPTHIRDRNAFQEFDIRSWFSDSAKEIFVLDNPSDAARIVRRAVQVSRQGRPGPVVIGLPEDLLTHQVPLTLEPRTVIPRQQGSDSDRDSLETALLNAQRPVAVVGGEYWHDADMAALQRWAEHYAVAVTSDFRAYDVFPNTSKSWIGSLGYGRDSQLVKRVAEADLVIFLGAVRSDVLSEEYTLALETTTLVISPDPELISHYGRVDQHYVANPAHFLNAWKFESNPSPRSSWLDACHNEWLVYSTPSADGCEKGVDMGELLSAVRSRAEASHIATFGAGNYALWVQRYVPAGPYPSVVAPKNGSMGMGVPAAVAASLVFGDRQVISFAGDGCFLMNGQELATAVTYGADFILFVIDNGQYGTIKQHQDRKYPGRNASVALRNPDFVQMAKSFGASGYRISDNMEIDDVIEAAFNDKGVRVVHVVTDSAVLEPQPKLLSQSV